jgi:hypothetical protein
MAALPKPAWAEKDKKKDKEEEYKSYTIVVLKSGNISTFNSILTKLESTIELRTL